MNLGWVWQKWTKMKNLTKLKGLGGRYSGLLCLLTFEDGLNSQPCFSWRQGGLIPMKGWS